jgi:predicted dithiol-disulfide oxidoreductase (DUF899 family)
MAHHPIVSQEEWLAARRALLAKEKELTRLQDALNEQRRELPWVRIDKDYVFDTPDGRKTLAELFDGRSQLFVYHFMFGPDWKAGCVGCSFFADHIDGPNRHLMHHDLTVAVVSRAPLAKIAEYKQRMGWNFPWVSSFGSDFNYDFHVSFPKAETEKRAITYNFGTIEASGEEFPGVSVFTRDESGAVFHTYSAYARGDERGLGAYMFLDLAPKGRNEAGDMNDWIHRHDEYGTARQ